MKRVLRKACLMHLYQAQGTLYSNTWYDLEPDRLGAELQAEGHASPDRIPPSDLARTVADGRR